MNVNLSSSKSIDRLGVTGLLLIVFGAALVFFFMKLPFDTNLNHTLLVAAATVSGWSLIWLGALLTLRRLYTRRIRRMLGSLCETAIAVGLALTLAQALIAPNIHLDNTVDSLVKQNYRRGLYDLQQSYLRACLASPAESCEAIDDMGRSVASESGIPNKDLIDKVCGSTYDPFHPPASFNYHLRDACSFLSGIEHADLDHSHTSERSDFLQIFLLEIIAIFAGLSLARSLYAAFSTEPD